MESMHFKKFLKTLNTKTIADFEDDIHTIYSKQQNVNSELFSSNTSELFDQYETYCQSTLDGCHGKTAQFWLMYVKFIGLYHNFERAIRTGDHKLFIWCLPGLMTLFFAFHHQNYARWLVRYHDNLLRMEDTHPGITQEFENGIISVRRTSKPFSRLPIDLTLEQTINADAANTATGKILVYHYINIHNDNDAIYFKGISAFTNSISARQRWANSHFLRTSVVSHVFETLGLKRQEDVSRESLPCRMKQDIEEQILIRSSDIWRLQ